MFPRKMLRKSKFWTRHFDEKDFIFLQEEDDQTSKQSYIKRVVITKPTRDLKAELLESLHAEEAQLALLADLLDKCLTFSPQHRITPEAALRHPFLCS